MFPLILFVLGILAGLLSFLEKRKSNKINGGQNNFNLFAFILLVISATLSLWSGYAAQKKSDENDILRKVFERRSDSMHSTIDSLNRVNITKSDTIDLLLRREFDTSKSILIYSQRLTKVQNDFLKFQIEATKKQVGDGTKPELIATITNDTIVYFLMNNSDYPIQDITIAVDPPTIRRDLTDISKIKDINIGTLHPHAAQMFADAIKFESNSNKLYFVCGVTWRYGNYTAENVVIKNKNSIILQPSKYYYNNGKEFQFNNSILKPSKVKTGK